MLRSKTLWETSQQTWLAQARSRQPASIPELPRLQLPVAAQRTNEELAPPTSSQLRQKAATASRLAGQIPYDPAAHRLRQLAADLERQAWAVDKATLEQDER